MRFALVLALTSMAGCGARTALFVGETSSPDATSLVPVESGSDAGHDASRPVDSGADAPISLLDSGFDSSSQTVECIWRDMGIAQVACPGGSACIPEQGCVGPNEIPSGTTTSACGVLACASGCTCSTEPFPNCDCANLP